VPATVQSPTARILAPVAALAALFGAAWWFASRPAVDPAVPGATRPVLPPPLPAAEPAVPAGADAREEPRPDAVTRDAGATAVLDMRLHCRGPARLLRVLFTVDAAAGERLATAERLGLAEDYAARITLPASGWLRAGAIVFDPPDAADGALVLPQSVRPEPGNQVRVDLQCGQVPATLRVVGPSPALLAHLVLELHPRPRFGAGPATASLPLAADGTVRLHLPDEPHRAGIRLAETPDPGIRPGWLVGAAAVCALQAADGSFDLAARSGELLLAPIEPLAGVVVGAAGRTIPAVLGFAGPPAPRPYSPCHVDLRQRVLGAALAYGTAPEFGSFTFRPADLLADADLFRLDPARIERLGQLRVRVPATGPAPLDLLAEPLGGGSPQRLERDGDGHAAALRPGDYRLRWDVRGGPGPAAAERVSVRAGETVELALPPLPLQRWTVQMLDADPKQSAIWFCRLGGVHSLGGARDGEFLFDLAEPPRQGQPAEVWSHALRAAFPATVVGADPGRRYAEIVSPATEVTWCRVQPRALADGRLTLRLAGAADAAGTARGPTGALASDTAVPLGRGGARNGCLCERIDDREQITAWFRLEHGVDELVVAPHGRWATLQIVRPVLRAQVLAQGPDGGTPVPAFAVDGAGEFPLYVAGGTRAVHVELAPGGRLVFAPEGPFVVR